MPGEHILREQDLAAGTRQGAEIFPIPLEPIAFDDPKIAYVVERCRGRRVLDLGCVMHDPAAYADRFFVHRAIREVARETVGLDLHAEGVAMLNARGCDVVVGDAENFTFDEPFDVIVAGDIIEHLGSPDGMLRSAVRALRPDGRIIVQTPNPWYWRNVMKAALHVEVPNNPEHTCWFDPRTLRQLAARYDLALRDIELHSRYRRDRFMPLPAGWRHTTWSGELVRS